MDELALDYIAEGLRGLAVPVESVHEDAANVRVGHAVERIAASLRQYGQRKPIVANRSQGGRVEAGNGTLSAARALGRNVPPPPDPDAFLAEGDDVELAAGRVTEDRVEGAVLVGRLEAELLGDRVHQVDVEPAEVTALGRSDLEWRVGGIGAHQKLAVLDQLRVSEVDRAG